MPGDLQHDHAAALKKYAVSTGTIRFPLTDPPPPRKGLPTQIASSSMPGFCVSSLCIACVDGLKGFPEAIESVYPRTEVQLCIVHLVRASLNYVNWKQRREVAGDLRRIYQAGTATEAEMQRDEFARKWDETYPMVSQIWRRNWERIIPFFAYPGEIRKVIYTTNTIESLKSH